MLVAHVLSLPPRLFEGWKVTAAEPSKPEKIKLLVDVERRKRGLKFLCCLDEAFRVLMEKSAPALGVVDGVGRLKGLITSETVGEMLMVRDAMPKGFRLGKRARPARA